MFFACLPLSLLASECIYPIAAVAVAAAVPPIPLHHHHHHPSLTAEPQPATVHYRPAALWESCWHPGTD